LKRFIADFKKNKSKFIIDTSSTCERAPSLNLKEFEDLIKGFEDKREQAVELDLNLAFQKDLESLPGIGPSLAKEIIQYRVKNGKFTKPEELLKVKGMGLIRYEALRSYFKVNNKKGKLLKKIKKSVKYK